MARDGNGEILRNYAPLYRTISWERSVVSTQFEKHFKEGTLLAFDDIN